MVASLFGRSVAFFSTKPVTLNPRTIFGNQIDWQRNMSVLCAYLINFLKCSDDEWPVTVGHEDNQLAV